MITVAISFGSLVSHRTLSEISSETEAILDEYHEGEHPKLLDHNQQEDQELGPSPKNPQLLVFVLLCKLAVLSSVAMRGSMWDDISESTCPKSPQDRRQIKTNRQEYQIPPINTLKSPGDESPSLTSKSMKTVRLDLLNDHMTTQRTSSASRRKQLTTEFDALKSAVESSYKSYRKKKRTSDHLTARYLQWTSWFKKRYSTDPTTKLTRREFEKLWSWFSQLSTPEEQHPSQQLSQQQFSKKKKSTPQNNSASSSPPSSSSSSHPHHHRGIQLKTIVDLFVEYGVFETHHSAMKLLKTIDTDRSQTITFLEFMDGINSSDLTQTLQLRYFISSLVYERKIISSPSPSHGEKEKNLLGPYSNALLRTRLRRTSTMKTTTRGGERDDEEQEEEGESRRVGTLSFSSVSSPSRAQLALSTSRLSPPRSPPSYTTSHPHPLASRLRAKLANPSRVYVRNDSLTPSPSSS
jgi:hypothetical protein